MRDEIASFTSAIGRGVQRQSSLKGKESRAAMSEQDKLGLFVEVRVALSTGLDQVKPQTEAWPLCFRIRAVEDV